MPNFSTMTPEEFWRYYSEVYGRLRALDSYMTHIHWAINSLGIGQPKRGERPRLFDAGCGDGTVAHLLYERDLSRVCDYVGVDSSPAMLKRAAAETRRLQGQTSLYRLDLANPASYRELGGRRFTHVLAINLLYTLTDEGRQAFLEGAASVAGPGALMWVSTPGPDMDPMAVLNEHLEWYASNGGDPERVAAEKARLLEFLAPVVACQSYIRENFPGEEHRPDKGGFLGWFGAGPWRVRPGSYSEVYGKPAQNHSALLELS